MALPSNLQVDPISPRKNRVLHRRKPLLHVRIADELRLRISQGAMPIGSVLPSRRALAEEFDTAVGTVQKAIAELTADGTLEVRGRWGTFVASNEKTAPSSIAGLRKPTISTSFVQAGEGGTKSSDLTTPMLAAVIGAFDTQGVRPQQSDFWSRVISRTIERSVEAANGHSVFTNRATANGHFLPIHTAINNATDNGANVILLIYPPEIPEALSIAAADLDHIPIIVVGSELVAYPFYSAYYDSRDAGCQAAIHLIRNGFKNITLFAPYTADWVRARCKGVVDAMRRHEIPIANLQVQIDSSFGVDVNQSDRFMEDSEHEARAYLYASKLFQGGFSAQAVVAANDFIAYGYMKAAAEHGLQAGRDYAIIGFDDAPRSQEMGLTTLQSPLEELGREAVQIAIRALRGERSVLRSCLHSKLAIRGTSQLRDPA